MRLVKRFERLERTQRSRVRDQADRRARAWGSRAGTSREQFAAIKPVAEVGCEFPFCFAKIQGIYRAVDASARYFFHKIAILQRLNGINACALEQGISRTVAGKCSP